MLKMFSLIYSLNREIGEFKTKSFEVHKDSPEAHQKALKMGANIIQYVLMGGENVVKK